VGSSRGAGQPLDWPRFPARPLPRSPPPWPRGLLLRELVQEHGCLGDASEPGRRPPSATGDKVMALMPCGRGMGAWWIRGMGAWWIQAVEMKRLPTFVAARFLA